MNVRRETPSILELCHRHNKKKDQEVASNLKDCLESRKDPAVRGLCSGQSCPAEAYQSNVSPEMRQKFFPYAGLIRNELRFSSVETRSSLVFYDSYDSDRTTSSEEDCDTPAADPFQAQNGYVWANNLQAARFYDELKSQPQREQRESFRKIRHRVQENTKSFPPTVVSEQRQGRQGYVQKEAVNTEGYSHSQANKQCRPHYRHAVNGLGYPLRLQTNDPLHYSRHCQDLENVERRQTYSGTSSLYEYMQRNEANSIQGSHNESNERETKLPPIQPLNDRARDTEPLPRQFRVRKQRRQGRREECEANNQRGERRKGVCPVTDSAREQRTFVRVLGKRF